MLLCPACALLHEDIRKRGYSDDPGGPSGRHPMEDYAGRLLEKAKGIKSILVL